jgi:hypothetical protein
MPGLPHIAQIGGRYRLDEVLRKGGGVTTYAGVDTSTGAAVVVKEMKVGELGEWKEYDLFRREVEVLAALSHPGIPRLLSHVEGTDLDAAYLVMERVPGRSLDHAIQRGQPLPLTDVIRVLEGVARVLDYLHTLAPPIIHRDLKPGNIVLDHTRVFLVDFGGVRRFLPWAKGGSTMVGTFGYMAPEQLQGEATPATDLYSLGATIAALLAGCDAQELPRNGLRFLIDQIPAARPPLREIVRRLVEPEPGHRFHSAAELLGAMARSGLLNISTNIDMSGAATREPRVAAGALERRALGDAAPLGYAETHALSPLRDIPATRIGEPTSAYWTWRALARWGLIGTGSAAVLAGLGLEAVRVMILFGWIPFVGEIAMALCATGLAMTLGGLFVRTKGGFRRRILRRAAKQGGRIHVAEAAAMGLPPERALELLEELAATGVAQRDPELAGVYYVGVR